MKTLTFTFSGDENILNAGITSYSKSYGWTEKITNDEGEEIDNPISALDFIEKPILQHFFQVVQSYNGRIAEQYAKQQSDIATAEAMKKLEFNVS